VGGNAYKTLVGKALAKLPLGRPKRRWKDNVKWDHESKV
jgi:hypothetical protein